MAGSHCYSAGDSGQVSVDAGSKIRSASPVVKLPAHEVWVDPGVAISNLTARKFGVFENPPPSWDSPHGVIWETAGWRRTMAQRGGRREMTGHAN